MFGVAYVLVAILWQLRAWVNERAAGDAALRGLEQS